MIQSKWIDEPTKGGKAYTRWLNQFLEYAGKKTYDEILNLDVEVIESLTYNWIQYLKSIPETECTINQKITALITFYWLHDIVMISERIDNDFVKYPLYHINKLIVITK